MIRASACCLLASLLFAACSRERVAEAEVPALPEKFSELTRRYSSPEDSLKYRAACYLLEGLPRQWHYDVELFDRTGGKNMVMDMDVIDADYLAENIEYAFMAWALPWCRDLDFEEFCRLILPYKMADEQPVRWRRELWEEFSWVVSEAGTGSTPRDICRMVNASVDEWFTVNWDNPYQLDINFFQAKELKEAACYGASMMILYPLRALGVPAVFEGVPRWVNRSGAHFWNAVYDGGSLCTFNGPDRDPGMHKVQFVGVGRMLFKMSKVWRRDYLEGRVDVTGEYIPVCDLTVDNIPSRYGSVGLASFDNRNWQTVADAPVSGRKATFRNMARGGGLSAGERGGKRIQKSSSSSCPCADRRIIPCFEAEPFPQGKGASARQIPRRRQQPNIPGRKVRALLLGRRLEIPWRTGGRRGFPGLRRRPVQRASLAPQS